MCMCARGAAGGGMAGPAMLGLAQSEQGCKQGLQGDARGGERLSGGTGLLLVTKCHDRR